MDRIDELIGRLEKALPEVTWDRDAVSEDAGENTGAVEMTGGPRAQYADGKMIAQVLKADVWLCVRDSGAEYLETVQGVLEDFGEKYDGGFAWGFPARGYSPNIDNVVWRWSCELDGLETEEDPRDGQNHL